MAPTSGTPSAIRSRAFEIASNSSNTMRQAHSRSQNTFASSKKDKRIIKRSALISRIEKNKAQPTKRRRPSKKLVANLDSIAAALPDTPPKDEQVLETGIARIRHRSLKSKPGALKKKEKIISLEKDRFNKNMAQMAAVQGSDDGKTNGSHGVATGTDSQSRTKWAALRSFIQQTMEQRPAS
ncbi:MAG: hypothetical protein Q9182_001472 [Xanthomendoza sp. 2 TL-2023]